MTEVLKRKRGAPRGNQNARKHGFYSPVLDQTDKRNLHQAAFVEGLDQEIDLLRAKIKSVVEQDSGNIRLISQAVVSLARLLRTKTHLAKDDNKGLRIEQALKNVYYDIARPLGDSPEHFCHLTSQFPGLGTRSTNLAESIRQNPERRPENPNAEG
jgi:uncharacterized protein YjcR